MTSLFQGMIIRLVSQGFFACKSHNYTNHTLQKTTLGNGAVIVLQLWKQWHIKRDDAICFLLQVHVLTVDNSEL